MLLAASETPSTAEVVRQILGSPVFWGVLATAVGLWLLLPRRTRRGYWLGALAAVVGLVLIGWQLPRLAGWLDDSAFAALALTTIVAAAGTISARNPLYSAIWFGLTLLGVSALFFFQGAQFLSVATITVYAGAILVTFLFVIMLAQPSGQAYYDRLSWEALLSAAAGAVLIGVLTGAIGTTLRSAARDPASMAAAGGETPAAQTESPDSEGSPDRPPSPVLAQQHVAALGRELLGRHLVSMQAAGALMLAALVGAVAIVAQGRGKL